MTGTAVALTVLGVGSVVGAVQNTTETRTIAKAPVTALAPPAPPETAVTPLAASEPMSIAIPDLGVTSEVMDLGLRPDGSMEVPPGAYPAGWYTGAPTPGELGPAIIAAHVDWQGRPGVFVEIDELEPGNEIRVPRSDGSTAFFQVDRLDRYPKNRFPTEAVYGDIDHAGLRLITCGGDFDGAASSYTDNVVVYASLVRSTSI